MEEILEYKKLLRQRDKLVKKLSETTDEEEQKELDAQVQDIDELIEHMRTSSKAIQDFLNKDSSNEIVIKNEGMKRSEPESSSKDKEKEFENYFYGCLGVVVICVLIFLGLKSCIGCDGSENESKQNYSLVQNEHQRENEERIARQQEQMKKQQEEMEKQQEQLREQEERLRQQEEERAKLLQREQHEQLVRSSLSVTDGRFEPNFFDGYIYFSFTLANRSANTIKYLYIWVDILNSVGDPIQNNWCGKYTGPLNGGRQDAVSFKLTNNQQASLYRVKRIRIEYMDGTFLEISPDEINQIYKSV